jgi:general L-amino acid transport system permease protein
VPPWRDVRFLRIAAQLLVIGGVVVGGGLLMLTLGDNLRASRLTFGFGFLSQTSGIEISQSPITYSSTDTFARALAVGVLNTLLVSIVGIILATLLGIVVGVARLSNNWLARRVASGYVEIMRNTPLLVQLVLIGAVIRTLPGVANSIELPGSIYLNSRGLYLPRPEAGPGLWLWLGVAVLAVIGVVGLVRLSRRRREGSRSGAALRWLLVVGAIAVIVGAWFALSPLRFDVPERERFNFSGGVAVSPAFTALLVGLVIYTAAFIGEVVRGGIQAVRRGQVEAAYAIGLTPGQTLRLVVFPQAMRIIVPPLTSQYLNLTKNSSLALAVGYVDLFAVGRTMANQTGQPLSVIVLVMGIYLGLSLFTSALMNLYNRRVQVEER